jgi:hypothetical protein
MPVQALLSAAEEQRLAKAGIIQSADICIERAMILRLTS